MSILNKNDSYYLHPELGPTKASRDRNFLDSFYNFADKPYWHVSCFDGKSLRFLKEVLPEDILQQIRDRRITLSIGAEYEVFVDVPDAIYEFAVKDLSLPAESILLFSANARIEEIANNAASSRNLPKIQARWVCIFERTVGHDISRPLDTLQIKSYPKKFISLNRRWRACRLALVSYLKVKNLLDQGFVSLQSFDGRNWDNSWDYMMQLQDNENKKLFEKHKDEIINLPNLKLDDTDLEDMNPVTHDLDDCYLNSYFSIVGGTAFYEKETSTIAGLCEKTFKAIQKKHPFILMQPVKNLPLLHGMGYKTFDGLIDESYDNEADDNKRMRMIVSEIERLCNLSDTELETFLTEAKKIVDHNFKNLMYRSCLPRV
jgi:hypothetical protein